MKEKRTKIVPVRLTKTEEELLKEKAQKVGLSLSTFLRTKALE